MSEATQFPQDDSSVNSIIGEGTTLSGDFDLNGLLRIDGTFYGKVKTSGKVLVGKNGVAECVIVAGTVVIGGKVRGEVVATEGITLLSTGEMNGTLKTPHLVIEEGVVFNGKCEVIEDREKLQKVREELVESRFNVSGKSAEKTAVRAGVENDLRQPLHFSERASLEKAKTAVS